MRRLSRALVALAAQSLRLAPLGHGWAARARLTVAGPLMIARWHLPRRAGRDIHVRVKVGGVSSTLVIGGRDELAAIDSILAGHEYGLALPRPPTTILDLGSNVGASVLWFRGLYPDAAIHAFEPDPAARARLEQGPGRLPGVVVHPYALVDRDGPVTLHLADTTWASSVVADYGGRRGSAWVPGRTLPSVLDELGLERVDLLKFDIEGAEYAALLVAGALDGVDALIGELHAEPAPGGSTALLAALDGFDVDVRRHDGDVILRAVRRG